MKKSFYALLFSLVLAIVTLIGCGGSSAAAGSSGKVTLESAPEQTDSHSGTDQESSGADGQSSELQSAPDQVAEDTKDEAAVNEPETAGDEPEATIDENGTYTSKDDVALYLHVYGRLPKNFMTKKEAKKLGWEGGSLERFAKGMCIGGDHFGNYEGILPRGNYYECDIDTLGKKSRGAKRIIYSDDGRIYYTDDHYETFELLYGEE
ncbi:MAG: ribonuclease [Parasporobacterium sp.]|nr:ribonuclease [Parasporobacterium sp.]